MPANPSESILTARNVGVVLNGRVILEDISFAVDRQEFFTIIGPNGSGKTTLFRALIGMIPHTGEIRWAPDVRIGYVPQQLDLERNLPLSLRDFLRTKSGSADNLEAYLELVHLAPELLDRPLGALSGGEFQRALVAFALIGDTTVLLFDEPTAGIDRPSEEQIYETLHRLQDERGLTIITISHDLSLVNRYATKVLCLNKRNICFGTPEEALQSKNLAELYGAEHFKYFHHQHYDH
ncbi:metal ABC transporter ATP-binding protein [Candidatus Parcubacteria bacterium]|nr:MAG: metal ABC transporter ATP-binding protein [Candidatus Parcubacteria bacterium]